MRLYPRTKSNGTRVWWASWTEDGVTVRRSTRASTKDAAALVVARWERERADPIYAAAQSATFGVEAGRFVRSCESAVARGEMAEPTLSMYRQKAGALVRILGAERPLASINGETFAQYIDDRRKDFELHTGKEIRSTTLYKEWIAFRRIMEHARRGDRYQRDPRALKPEHFGPGYEPRKLFLTWEQVDKLLAELVPERRKAVSFALATGARRKEVFAARAGDHDGKRVLLRGSKTDASHATIPVPAPMRRLLTEPPFAPWPNARRGLDAACKRAGVPSVSWNDLRRTFASLLVQSGVSPYVVSKLLRHTTTAMTDLVYGRQDVGALETLLEGQIRGPSVDQDRPPETSKRNPRRTTKREKPRKNSGPTGT